MAPRPSSVVVLLFFASPNASQRRSLVYCLSASGRRSQSGVPLSAYRAHFERTSSFVDNGASSGAEKAASTSSSKDDWALPTLNNDYSAKAFAKTIAKAEGILKNLDSAGKRPRQAAQVSEGAAGEATARAASDRSRSQLQQLEKTLMNVESSAEKKGGACVVNLRTQLIEHELMRIEKRIEKDEPAAGKATEDSVGTSVRRLLEKVAAERQKFEQEQEAERKKEKQAKEKLDSERQKAAERAGAAAQPATQGSSTVVELDSASTFAIAAGASTLRNRRSGPRTGQASGLLEEKQKVDHSSSWSAWWPIATASGTNTSPTQEIAADNSTKGRLTTCLRALRLASPSLDNQIDDDQQQLRQSREILKKDVEAEIETSTKLLAGVSDRDLDSASSSATRRDSFGASPAAEGSAKANPTGSTQGASQQNLEGVTTESPISTKYGAPVSANADDPFLGTTKKSDEQIVNEARAAEKTFGT
mmetsp:Transcript_8548/g.20719  ORF Transcript_8548/g.20719 Transcript_8548/m.20719 type:complete len:476 (+) Transcript_8548:144-1571(+)